LARRVTIRTLKEKKATGDRITMLTAYDYPTARLLDEAGVDVLLVGDSVGMVVQGHDTTLPVTMEQMVYHTSLVARAAQRALVVGDMPFLSYHLGAEEALRNAGRLLQAGGATAVKLEGGAEVAPIVERLVAAGIPVMGHIGLTPQSVHALGGWYVQGRTPEAARRLAADAKALEAAGVFALVLELVPAELARVITASLSVPTIGIGSGPHCDGQVLVFHDLVGLDAGRGPRHARRYAELGEAIRAAAAAFVADVARGDFPAPEHATWLGPEAEARLAAELGGTARPAAGGPPEEETKAYGG
jgi:3-methyl-2-oxobutanoate hydroxymethyltransferase